MNVPEADETDGLDGRFAQAFENAPLGMTIISARPERFGTFDRVNRAYCRLLGRSCDEVIGHFYTTFIAPEDRARSVEQMNELRAGSTDVMCSEVRMIRGDGSLIWVRLTRSLMTDSAGPVCFITHLEDISERRAAQAALAEMTARLRRSLEDAPIGMALTSIERASIGRFIEVNPALCRITGLTRTDFDALTFEELIHPDGRAQAAEMTRKLIARESERANYRARCVRADGTTGWLAIHASIAYDNADRPMYCIAQIIDITQQKEAESRLEHLAYHDALTGLLNRSGLAREVTAQCIESATPPARSALLLVDLDHFAYVNETMGHAAGDKILAKVAGILRRSCPGDAILARLSADEFLAVLPNADEAGAVAAAASIRRAIGAHISLSNDTLLRATASIGIVCIDDWTRQSVDLIIASAGGAVADAKAHGRNRTSIAGTLAKGRVTMREELTWSQRIRIALERDDFTLYAQPILNLRTGIVERFELLLRLVDADGRVHFPGEFLPVAERNGLVADLDCWVVTRAIEMAARERRTGSAVVFEVNLSGASLTNATVMACITRELRRNSLDPRALVFEITETAAIANMDEACRFAERIAALGCAFALDDFGSGFSSFYYLKYLPFSDLKIDGEFIRHLTTNPSDQHIVRAMVEVARGLGKATIAEFVGDAETAVLLQSYGVDYAQGYYIGQPVPWAAARSMLPQIRHTV